MNKILFYKNSRFGKFVPVVLLNKISLKITKLTRDTEQQKEYNCQGIFHNSKLTYFGCNQVFYEFKTDIPTDFSNCT